jgi:uncharacterized SAM-binding protein YcdF (DUF218 family)
LHNAEFILMPSLLAAGDLKLLRLALALLACFVLTDVILSFVAWRAAAAFVHEADVASVCAPASHARAAIVVFYSDDAPMRRERLAKAADLARFCPSALIFLVGGARPHRNYFGSEEMAGQLEGAGIARSRIRTERASYDTATNVAEAKAMAAAGAARLALVSDALHLLRIHAVFGQTPPGMELSDFPTGGDAGLLRMVSRANYEAAAWLAMLAPQTLRELAYKLTGRRRTGPADNLPPLSGH